MRRNRKTYASAGVSLKVADAIADNIGSKLKSTFRKGCISLPGGFAGLFDLEREGLAGSTLVLSTDGVGTKIKLAIDFKMFTGLGIDLVAMSVNDVLTMGAQPLCFLDYMAFGKIDKNLFDTLLASIVDGCKQSGCALMGGETAEMPGLYRPGDFDLAGFCVGAVKREAIIDGSKIQVGDVIMGLPSSGIHSNGYSLVRSIVADVPLAQLKKQAKALMQPTKIYVREVLALINQIPIKGMAHITGGGLAGNVTRIVPQNMMAEIAAKNINVPPIFDWLREQGNVSETEMFNVFNMGIGFVMVCEPRYEKTVRQHCPEAERIGNVVSYKTKRADEFRARII